MAEKKRSPNGGGSITKTTRKSNGKVYEYWRGTYTVGYDPGTGKQIQKAIYGKTKAEVAEKLRKITNELDEGRYIGSCKTKVGEWLDTWCDTYLVIQKSSTAYAYKRIVQNHLKPALGAIRLDKLDTTTIQRFYNSLTVSRGEKKALTPKTVRNIHGVLREGLQKAKELKMIADNPADICILPRAPRKEPPCLDQDAIVKFLDEIKGHEYEDVFRVTLFTGMREGEVLGLSWDDIDFKNGRIKIKQQLQKEKVKSGKYILVSPKNGKTRLIAPSPWVMDILRQHKKKQEEAKRRVGALWDNPYNLVFTNEVGRYLIPFTVTRKCKEVFISIGHPEMYFHGLRHTYAFTSLRAGDDPKTLQGNMGHATVAFTLDTYCHVLDSMRIKSAENQQAFIENVLGLKSDKEQNKDKNKDKT